MAKHKTSAALFEVIARGDSKGLKTPSWVNGDDSAAAAERPATSLKRPPGLDGSAQSQAQAPTESEPMAALIAGRLRLNLGYISCLVISLGLIVLLAAAYKLGQAGRPAPTGKTTAGQSGMFGDRTGGDRAYSYEQAQQAAESLLPSVGRDILIIQSGVASMEDAKAIQKYLWSRGLTPLVHQQNNLISVLDTADVSNMTAEDLQTYKKRLADWGSDPQWLLGRKYKFDQTATTPRTN